MKNCLILGSGRSGTSMLAGVLAQAGFFMGDELLEPRESNPKGFFESFTINQLNEDLIGQVLPARPPVLGRWWFKDRPLHGQRWLARVPVGTQMPCSRRDADRIAAQVTRPPFCFKDPRFSYTLPAWRPFLQDTVFLCVFRDPMVTAASIVKECVDMKFLHTLAMDMEIAVEVWTLMYEHILQHQQAGGDWLFLHYDQVLHGDGLDRIEKLVEAPIDRSFPDAKLRRSTAREPTPPASESLYARLCACAGHEL